jgi:hypothetical protein
LATETFAVGVQLSEAKAGSSEKGRLEFFSVMSGTVGIASGTRHNAGWVFLNEPEIFNSLPTIRLISILILIFSCISCGLGGAAFTFVGYSEFALGSWWAALASAIVAVLAIFTMNKTYIIVNFSFGILAVISCIAGAVMDSAYSAWFASFKACTMNTSADPYQFWTWDASDADSRAIAASQLRATFDPTNYDTCFCAGKNANAIGKVRVFYNSCYMIMNYSGDLLAGSCATTAISGALTFILCCYQVFLLSKVRHRKLDVEWIDVGITPSLIEDDNGHSSL